MRPWLGYLAILCMLLVGKPKGILAAGGPCCGGGEDKQSPQETTRVAIGDVGAVALSEFGSPSWALVCVSSLRTACGGPLGGQVEEPGDFTGAI